MSDDARLAHNQAYGDLGPVEPRLAAVDQQLLATAPPAAVAYERTAYLPKTEVGEFGSGSGFGGRPFLPPGVDHPVCPGCGKPMPLVAQLETASLPPGTVSGSGLIQLFYCTDCDADLDGWMPFSRAHVQCLVAASTAGATSPVTGSLPSHRVTGWRPVREIPGWEELGELDVDAGDPPDEVEDLPYVGEKLGGWPAWVQGVEYPACPRCDMTMRLVLQVDSERLLPIMFGDMGIAHLTQCPNHPEVLGFGWASS